MMECENYDVVIVGAGLAGMTAAFRCVDAGRKVCICTDNHLCSGSSFYPKMDAIHCQAPDNDEDKNLFLEDINIAGEGINDSFMNQYYLDHITENIEYLASLGVPVHRLKEKKLACFAEHPHRLYTWSGWEYIRRILSEKLKSSPNVTIREHSFLAGIITEGRKARGIVVSDHLSPKCRLLWTSSVILATGGFGNLYQHNLNTADVSGSSQALALMTGASLVNLEFNQFIPGFLSPAYKTIFREGSFLYCRSLLDASGQDILRNSIPDEINYQNILRQRSQHGPFTASYGDRLIDLTLFRACKKKPSVGVRIIYDEAILQERRSYIQNYIHWLKDSEKTDITGDAIYIAPFFHAANGGIQVGHSCETEIEGLFACGECAGGIHGANRLGGNASGSCLVFGTLSANTAMKYVEKGSSAMHQTDKGRDEDVIEKTFQMAYPSLYKQQRSDNAGISLNPNVIVQKLQSIMWLYANVERNREGLMFALDAVCELEKQLPEAESAMSLSIPLLKTAQELTLAKAVLLAMVRRTESRGSHYRSDFPYKNPDMGHPMRICRQDVITPIP